MIHVATVRNKIGSKIRRPAKMYIHFPERD